MTEYILKYLSPLRVHSDDRASICIAFMLACIAKFQSAVGVSYAVDDYQQTLYGLKSLSGSMIRQGRFGEYWLSEAFSVVGYDPARSPILSVLICLILSVWTASTALRLWQIDMSIFPRALIIFIISSHPYTSEILTFRGIAVYHLIAFALAFAAIALARPAVTGIVIPSFVLSAALTIYQVPVSYIAVFMIFDIAVRLIKGQIDSGAFSFRIVFEKIVISRILVVIFGFAMYFVWLKISTWGLPPHHRSVLIDFSHIPARSLQAAKLVLQHFVTGKAYDQALVPQAIMWLALAVVAVAAYEICAQATSFRRAVLGLTVWFVTLLLVATAMLGLPLVAKALVLPPRVLPQIGLVWGGAFAIALMVSSKPAQHFVTGLLGVVAFAFVALNQQIFIDQIRVNTRDHNLTLRILARLEDMDGFPAVRRIAVNGSRQEDIPVPTAIKERNAFNRSSYLGSWSVAAMFSELSGKEVASPNVDERQAAIEYCKSAAPWPSKEAVTIRDKLAIVCLNP